MKKAKLVWILTVMNTVSMAQPPESDPLRLLFKVEYGLMGNLGLTYERPIGGQWSVNLGGEIRLSPLLINMNPTNTKHNFFFWFNTHPIFLLMLN